MNRTTIQTIRNLSHTGILLCLGTLICSLILKEFKRVNSKCTHEQPHTQATFPSKPAHCKSPLGKLARSLKSCLSGNKSFDTQNIL
jgi:hypothetical protein